MAEGSVLQAATQTGGSPLHRAIPRSTAHMRYFAAKPRTPPQIRARATRACQCRYNPRQILAYYARHGETNRKCDGEGPFLALVTWLMGLMKASPIASTEEPERQRRGVTKTPERARGCSLLPTSRRPLSKTSVSRSNLIYWSQICKPTVFPPHLLTCSCTYSSGSLKRTYSYRCCNGALFVFELP
jgi:hypothetical protein